MAHTIFSTIHISYQIESPHDIWVKVYIIVELRTVTFHATITKRDVCNCQGTAGSNQKSCVSGHTDGVDCSFERSMTTTKKIVYQILGKIALLISKGPSINDVSHW